MNDNLPETTDDATTRRSRSTEPIPNPGLEPHQWRPTDVDPKAEKRAERQVAGLFGLAIVGAVLFVVSYFVFKIGDDPRHHRRPRRLQRRPRRHPGRGPAGHGRRHHPVGPQADGRPRDRRDAPPAPRPPRRTARRPSASSRPGSRSPGLGRRPLIRNSLLAAGGVLGILPIVMLRDLGPLPGDKLDHTIWDINTWTPEDAGVVGDPGPHVPAGRPRRRRYADQGHRARDRRPGQRRARDRVRRPTPNGQPLVEGTDLLVAKSKAAVILHRMVPSEIVSEQT